MKSRTKRIIAGVLAVVIAIPVIVSMVMPLVYGLNLSYTNEEGKSVSVRDFRDTQGHWAQETCYLWADYGVINGVGDAKFAPDDYIKRCDLACILDRLLGLKMIAYNHYFDLDITDPEGNEYYYVKSLLRCAAYNYIQGDETASGLAYILPLDLATREQVATILYRVFEMDRKDIRVRKTFADNNYVSSWAKDAVGVLSTLGFINGYPDGTFKPQGYITRAEFVTMLSNISGKYFANDKQRTEGTTFVNLEESNEVVALGSLTQSRSTIEGDIYCTQSNTELKLDTCTVDGTLYVFGDMVNITLNNTHIDKIEAFGQVIIKGASNVDEFIQHEWAGGSSLDDIVDTITLAPHTLINIDSGYYENDTDRYKTYEGEEILQDMASEGMILSMSPSISCSNITIDSNNDITVTALKPEQRGTGILKTFGLLIMEGIETPTISDYDDKVSFRESYLDSVYEDDITSTRGSLTEVVYNQPDDTVYTYVPYAMNTNGLIAYGTPVTIRSFDWDYEVKLVDTGSYPERMRFECWLYGDSLPKVSNVTCYYSDSLDYSEQRTSMGMGEDTSVNTRDSKKRKYTCELESKIVTHEDGSSEIITPRHFGVEIIFENNDDKIYKYPILTNATPSELSPVTTITTGSITSRDENSLKVTGNVVKASLDNISEYGVVYTKKNSSDKDTWDRVRAGGKISNNSTQRFDVAIPISFTSGTLHYAAYVKNDLGYYYGSVNSFSSSELGDEDGPQITQNLNWLSMSNTGGILNISATGLNSVNIKSFVDNTTGNNLTQLLGVYSNLGDYSDAYALVYNDSFYGKFDNLTSGHSYTVQLQCYNEEGKKSDIQTITFEAGQNKLYTAIKDYNANHVNIVCQTGVEITSVTCEGENMGYSTQLGCAVDFSKENIVNLVYTTYGVASLPVVFNFSDKL